MSIFNRPFRQPIKLGFGFQNDAPAAVISGQSRRPFQHLLQMIEKKQELDDLLSQAMTGLTCEERKEHQEILHGVNVMTAEDETLLDSVLQGLERNLAKVKSGSVYEVAESMDPAYVGAKSFRVMFLRANEYNPKAAADQMLRFFDMKRQLFGIAKLVKDITISEDFDEDDIARLKTSLLQLAGRDRSGRQVFIHFGGRVGDLVSSETIQSVLRAQYYVTMKALQSSEETQIRGIVSIWYALGDLKTKEHKGWFERFTLARALPQKIAAIHLCLDEMPQFAPASVMVKVMEASMRARMRTHYGSLTECKYQLSTYGISPESLPLDVHGKVNLEQQLQWVQSCSTQENKRHRPIPSTGGLDSITSPNLNDVLFTGGKVDHHLGNQRFQALICDFGPAYDAGTDELRRLIVGEIIVRIHKIGGSFLKKQGKGANMSWEEVPIEKLRIKIMQAFRNRRRRLDAFKHKSTMISGEPVPADVIFGRGQTNPGNDLLHRLVKEHSQEYESLNRGVKVKLVEGVMKTIKDQGGRFLEPERETNRWVEVSHDNARERISTYFRNHRRPSKRVIKDIPLALESTKR